MSRYRGILTAGLALCVVLPLAAQTGRLKAPKVPIAFNRFYDHAEIGAILRRLRDAWPQFLSLKSIGKSVGGRDLWLMTINNKKTGPEDGKAAMYIDANVHGNEVQGAEVCLYTIWYLMENYGLVERITKLVDQRVFYILPTVNPDGRDHWFHEANSSSSSRSGIFPVDDDRDGLLDEDPPDDLDGDGSIVSMRKKVPLGEGTYRIDPQDKRLLVRVKGHEKGDYLLLGREGIDNDGDGRLNEDGLGGYDMNRNNPADWMPSYVQYGAGDYPFSWPETRAVGSFLLAHPNIASVQSYHNSGGMILRGPGAASVPEYPRSDVAIYNELGKKGEQMLPFYRYMIIHKDLYTVHGGFVNFAAEGLGIIAFTNELWARPQFYDKQTPPKNGRLKYDDLVDLGAQYVPWKPFKHPEFGDIEIGGFDKWAARVPPAYRLEELCHRNAAFSLLQAEEMPLLQLQPLQVSDLGQGLFRIRATIRNRRLIPTRTALAASKKVGLPDFFTIRGGQVLAAGIVRGRFQNETITPVLSDLSKIRLERGVPGRGKVEVEWIVKGPGPYTIHYSSQKGGQHTQKSS